jgi:hypothetical protein
VTSAPTASLLDVAPTPARAGHRHGPYLRAALPEAAGEGAVGLAVWAVGAGWLVLAWRGIVAARRAAYVLGGAVTVVGSLASMNVDWGSGLALATAAGLVLAGVLLRDLAVLVVGSVATLLTVPRPRSC